MRALGQSHRYGRCCMHVVVVIFVVIIGSSSLHHHIASPILTRPRVHTGNKLGPEGAKALLPTLQTMTGLHTLDLESTFSLFLSLSLSLSHTHTHTHTQSNPLPVIHITTSHGTTRKRY